LNEHEEHLNYGSAEGILALVIVLGIIAAIVILFVLFKYNYFNGGTSHLKQT
jgi:hypothetical protein